MQWLKRIRVAVAVIFSLAVSSLFLDIYNIIPLGVRTFFTATQFFPVLMRTWVSIGLISVGLFFIFALTFLFGRVYCSTICPLGILQDVVIHLAKRINKRRWFKFNKPSYVVHYVLLAIMLIFAFSGSVILVNLLEPFSNYGRILSSLINPLIVLSNNAIAYLFEVLNFLFINRIPLLHIDVLTIIEASIFFGLIIYLSYYHGRIFCNLLCPAGALLGIVSRFSFYKIEIDKNNCTECGLCEMVCKANCIESDSKKIDFAACVGCFNCINKCKPKGISYKKRWKMSFESKKNFDADRRMILKSAVIPMLGLMKPEMGKRNRFEENGADAYNDRKLPISPPGSIGIDHFTNLCTACHLCVSSCPTQVLYPSFMEYGFAGIFQPKMNYSVSFCSYDCLVCGEVCPTGAILPLDPISKKLVQIGQAHFEKRNCVVITKNKDCGACSEHCPTKAVYMVPYKGLSLPEVNDELCIGCGACEYACPAEPAKAITVRSDRVHQKAKKPQSKKPAPSFDSSEDFPF